jgi:hypothetical protein
MFGQCIFVIPDKQMVVVFTSNPGGNLSHIILKKILDQYIIPAAVSSQPLNAQPKKKEHLDSMITNFAKAPAQGFIWISEKKGMAKDGEFIREASPSFRFKYPKASSKQATRVYGDIMRLKTPKGGAISVKIMGIPMGTKLAEVGPVFIANALKRYGSNIQVVSNKKIILKDGTVAYRTDINWKLQSSYRLRTMLVSAFKDRKYVSLFYSLDASIEASISESMNEGASVVESLTFR